LIFRAKIKRRRIMDMVIDFPGGARVDAHFGPFKVKTDQPPTASAPTPFGTFLAFNGCMLVR
jgi:ribosomal protein S12 methylthiotransferase accessory factor